MLYEILVEWQRCGLHVGCIMRHHYAARGAAGARLEYGGIFYVFGGVGGGDGYAVLLEELCGEHLIEHGMAHFGTRHGHKHLGMALLATRCRLYGWVYKGKHHMYVVVRNYFIEFGIHGGVAVTLSRYHGAHRGYGLLLAEFVAVNLHIAAEPFAGSNELLCHCHALGSAKHQYVEISMHTPPVFGDY